MLSTSRVTYNELYRVKLRFTCDNCTKTPYWMYYDIQYGIFPVLVRLSSHFNTHNSIIPATYKRDTTKGALDKG